MSTAIFLLCMVVTLACAAIALSAARKCIEQNNAAAKLVRALSDERGRIAAHDAELDQITVTLRKLSGRIGAARREQKREERESEPQGDADRLTWKAQMREKYGLTPRAN